MDGGDGSVEESENEKAQAQVAINRWSDYETLFKPHEDKFIADVDNMNSEANYQRATELAVSPLAKTFADEAMSIQKNMGASGVNPNSGKAKSMRSAITGHQAEAEIDAGSRAITSQQGNYISGLQNVVAMGQGQAGEAISGLSDLAQVGATNARSEAQNRLSNQNNIRSAIGAGVGAATSYGLSNSNDTGEE